MSFDDAAKATYFTPRVAGFQLGFSGTPDNSDNGGLDSNGNFTNAFAARRQLGRRSRRHRPDPERRSAAGSRTPAEPPKAAGFSKNFPNSTSSNDVEQYEVGGLIGAGGLSFGVTAGQSLGFNQGNFANAGLKYKFGAASASVGAPGSIRTTAKPRISVSSAPTSV